MHHKLKSVWKNSHKILYDVPNHMWSDLVRSVAWTKWTDGSTRGWDSIPASQPFKFEKMRGPLRQSPIVSLTPSGHSLWYAPTWNHSRMVWNVKLLYRFKQKKGSEKRVFGCPKCKKYRWDTALNQIKQKLINQKFVPHHHQSSPASDSNFSYAGFTF